MKGSSSELRCLLRLVPVVLRAAPLFAQTPPATDIYLIALTWRDGRVRLGDGPAANITNRAGYDNQPFFLPDGRSLLYTSIREDGQADIYRYDLGSGLSVRLTATPESEYSPTPTPNGAAFSVVRVEADSTQRLWQFDLDGSNPRLVLEAVKPVGYHAWGDAHTVALFVLGSPPTLQLADTRTGRAESVAGNIGRTLQRVPGRNAVSLVHKVSDTEWWITELDLATRALRPLVRTLAGVDFYAWTPRPERTLLAGRGTKLYQWHPARGTGWEEVADLAAAGLADISRLAITPRGDRLAVVAVPAPKPE